MKGFLGAALRSFSGRILGALSALIAAYSVTSHLSVADSGVFFLSLGFALFFSHFLRLGLDNFVLKKCSIFLNDTNYRGFLSILLVSVIASVAGSAFIYLALNIISQFIDYQYTSYLLLVFPAAVAIALVGIIAHSLHASGFVFTGAVSNTSAHFLIFSSFVWLKQPTGASEVIVLFIAACCLSLLIQIVISLFLFKRNGIQSSDWKEVQLKSVDYREIIDTTLPLWVVVLAQQLNQWGSQFISSVHVSESDLALLAIATRIALLVPMVLTAVNMVVSPKFAAHSNRGEIEKTEAVLKESLKLLLVVSSAVFLTMIFFGDNILSVFGPQYTQAASLLSILVFGQLINALTGPSGKLLMMSGFEKDVRNYSIVVTILGLALALFLVANYGVIGAAVSTALTIATQNLAFAYLVHRRLNINLLQIYAKIHK